MHAVICNNLWFGPFMFLLDNDMKNDKGGLYQDYYS